MNCARSLRLPRVFTGEAANQINRYMRKHEWSPEQIVGYCNLKDYAMVSVEKIYQYIRLDKRNERSKGYTTIKKLPRRKCAKGVAQAVTAALLPHKGFIRTITTDNGTECAEHKRIAEKLNTTVYFAHPYCSWEKGLIEYTNKLYRHSTSLEE